MSVLQARQGNVSMTPSPEQSSLVERLRVALSWIEPPFVTAETSADELRSRISFCLADAERALERLSQPSDGVTTHSYGASNWGSKGSNSDGNERHAQRNPAPDASPSPTTTGTQYCGTIAPTDR